MNEFETPGQGFHSLAIVLLRAQQTRQRVLEVEKSRERRSRTSVICAAGSWYRIAGIAIAILAVLLCPIRCFGQSTFGGIRGTVQDGSGAAIPDAQVTLHSVDENTDHVTKTDASGSFVLENVKAILDDQKLTFANVVKSTVFLTNLADFAGMNEVYAKYFTDNFPARSTIQVAALPKGASVEIEVVAHF